MSRYSVGALLVIASAVAFGTMSVIARKAFETQVSVEQLMLIRFSFASLMLGGAVLIRREQMPSRKKASELVVMGTGLYFLQSYALYNALQRIEAGLASLLLYLYPALVAVAAVVWLHERLTGSKLAALTMACAGVALTIGPVRGANLAGVAFGIASAVFYAGYILAGTKAMRGVTALVATFIVITSAVLPYALLVLAQGHGLPMHGGAYLWGALLSVSTVVAITTFLAGLSRVGPVDASTYSAIEPAVTAGLAFLILGERLTGVQILGGAIALAAVAFLARASSLGAKSRAMSG